jgi:hypothetical protein
MVNIVNEINTTGDTVRSISNISEASIPAIKGINIRRRGNWFQTFFKAKNLL